MLWTADGSKRQKGQTEILHTLCTCGADKEAVERGQHSDGVSEIGVGIRKQGEYAVTGGQSEK